MTPRTVEIGRHDKIRLYVYSELESVSGEIGDFRVRIRRKRPTSSGRVHGCGACSEACPQAIPVAFDRCLEMPKATASGKVRHVGTGKAIYTLSPQAVPKKPVIDKEYCTYFQKASVGCAKRSAPWAPSTMSRRLPLLRSRSAPSSWPRL